MVVKVMRQPLGVVLVSMWWSRLQNSFGRSLSHYHGSVTFYLVLGRAQSCSEGTWGTQLLFQWKEADKESVVNIVW